MIVVNLVMFCKKEHLTNALLPQLDVTLDITLTNLTSAKSAEVIALNVSTTDNAQLVMQVMYFSKNENASQQQTAPP